jgi:thiamine biosynthesis lipoprotein
VTARLEQLRFGAMGTACSVTVTMDARTAWPAERALAAARGEVAACERALSRFLPDSDLSRLNAAGGEWTRVDARLLAALAAAVEARASTGGRYDPTVLPALLAAGYDRSFDQLRPRPPAPLRGWRAGAAIDVDREAGAARVEEHAAVDLGGIGKGFAAARALAAMRAAWRGMPGAIVDLGGDLAVFGHAPDGGPWRIAVADARAPGEHVAILDITSGGVATSGRDKRRFGPGGRLHHLIDPATGRPAELGPLTATIVAGDAAAAEAHATALAVTPVAEAPAYLAERPWLAAVIVPDSGPVMQVGSPSGGVPALIEGVPA